MSAATQNLKATLRNGAGAPDSSVLNHSSKFAPPRFANACSRPASQSLNVADSVTPRKESAAREKAIPHCSSSAASRTMSVRFRRTFSLESLPVHTAMVRMCTACWQRSTPACPFGRKMIMTSVCEQCFVTRRASNVSFTSKESCQWGITSGSKFATRASFFLRSRVVCINRSASDSTALFRLMR